ncbi:MAG: hypothetical protein GXO42_01460 [bacterium]|nr:hypothetical protein [bacterium]
MSGQQLVPGQEVELRVDKQRRLQLMRMHTATHVLLRACREILGFHVWQQGSQLDEHVSRLDISHHKSLSEQEIEKIEELANEVLLENRAVKIFHLPRTEAEKRYGFEIYQGGIVPGREIRLVEIEGFDVQACGGLHVRNTGEVGLVKIIGVSKLQDGVYRLLYTAGTALLAWYRHYQDLLRQVCRVFSTQEDSVVRVAERFFEEWKERGKKIEQLLHILGKQLAPGKIYEFPGLNQQELIKLLQAVDAAPVIIVSGELVAVKYKGEEPPVLREKKGMKKQGVFVGKLAKEEIEQLKAWILVQL